MTALIFSFVLTFSLPFLISGTWLLVRPRRSDKPRPSGKSYLTDNLITSVITIGITILICLTFRWTGLIDSLFFRPSQRDYAKAQELGVEPIDVTFESVDGTELHGWFLPAKSDSLGTIVHLHGSDLNVTYTIQNCAWLHKRGFNVFAFDYRGYGKSAGSPTKTGVAMDSLAAIRYVRSRPDVDPSRVILWGQSMGGQLAITAAADCRDAPPAAVVSEATYALHSHHIRDKLAQMGPLWLLQWGPWLVTSDATAALPRVDELNGTSLLLVHGSEDRGVRPYHSQWLYDAASGEKEFWKVDGVKHLRIFQDTVYQDKLCGYFEKQLGPISTPDKKE